MSDPNVDAVRARLIQLGFKKSTEGLTPQEEQEMADLRQQLASRTMTRK